MSSLSSGVIAACFVYPNSNDEDANKAAAALKEELPLLFLAECCVQYVFELHYEGTDQVV